MQLSAATNTAIRSPQNTMNVRDQLEGEAPPAKRPRLSHSAHADLRRPLLIGIEWDSVILSHNLPIISPLEIDEDDCAEIRPEDPVPFDQLDSIFTSYSDALNSGLGHDQIGGPQRYGFGLHLHLDNDTWFETPTHMAYFLASALSYAPVLAHYSRVNANLFFCNPLDDETINGINQYFKKDLPEVETCLTMMQQINSIFALEKTTLINMEHDYFGEQGTLEIRFPQSPNRPNEVVTWTHFIKKMHERATDNYHQHLPLSINPQEILRENAYQIIADICGEDSSLRAEMEHLLDASASGPRTFVKQHPDSLSSRFSWAVKCGDLESVNDILDENDADAEYTVDGVNPYLYASILQNKRAMRALFDQSELISTPSSTTPQEIDELIEQFGIEDIYFHPGLLAYADFTEAQRIAILLLEQNGALYPEAFEFVAVIPDLSTLNDEQYRIDLIDAHDKVRFDERLSVAQSVQYALLPESERTDYIEAIRMKNRHLLDSGQSTSQ